MKCKVRNTSKCSLMSKEVYWGDTSTAMLPAPLWSLASNYLHKCQTTATLQLRVCIYNKPLISNENTCVWLAWLISPTAYISISISHTECITSFYSYLISCYGLYLQINPRYIMMTTKYELERMWKEPVVHVI
jgi:hypothetical protein